MRRRPSRSAPSIACGIALIAVLASVALVGPASIDAQRDARAAGAPAITSVKFSGSPTRPVVTITGHALSIPPANPKASPSNQPLCPRVIKGNAGLTYGTAFWVSAFQSDKQIWSAGRYRPALNELDCIGIIVLSHTATKVRFTFGAAYTQADFGYARITNGTLAEVMLRDAAFGLVVRYR